MKGATADRDLELKNFEYVGRTLTEICSGLVIDGNPAVAEFVEDDAPVIVETKSEEWKACHVLESQYFFTNCEIYKSKMLLQLSIIILESCSQKIFPNAFTSCSHA